MYFFKYYQYEGRLFCPQAHCQILRRQKLTLTKINEQLKWNGRMWGWGKNWKRMEIIAYLTSTFKLQLNGVHNIHYHLEDLFVFLLLCNQAFTSGVVSGVGFVWSIVYISFPCFHSWYLSGWNFLTKTSIDIVTMSFLQVHWGRKWMDTLKLEHMLKGNPNTTTKAIHTFINQLLFNFFYGRAPEENNLQDYCYFHL